MKILKDIRVVELGTYITGPAAGMHLADLGADVIKVERPGTGDPFRAFKGGLYSPHYQTYNRNKRSIALDTKDEGDRQVLHDATRIIERPLPINVSGAIPATILDAGWPLPALKAVPILARTAGLAAHLFEEQARSIGFIMSNHGDKAISYDGKTASREAAE